MITLTIDTSKNILGIAILEESELIAQKITRVNQDHSSRLMPAIVELMDDVKIKPNELGKIVVAEGPGSYTGIRIGVTVAKSLAWSLNIPIIAVSSLESLAYQAQLKDGFGFQLGVDDSKIQSFSLTSTYTDPYSLIQRNTKGLEEGQNLATVILFTNAKDVFNSSTTDRIFNLLVNSLSVFFNF